MIHPTKTYSPPLGVIRMHGRSRNSGFTLVEVVLAIGIVVMSIVRSLVCCRAGWPPCTPPSGKCRSPHPAGYRRPPLRDGLEHQRQPHGFHSASFYYTDEGIPVTDSKQSLYTVCLEISNPLLPGSDNPNSYLCTVTMKVTDLPPAVQPFNDATKYHTFVATIARMDKVVPSNP
ncbi:MAG: hypothetical protein WDN28_21340 [Chthoniobacter sp.]